MSPSTQTLSPADQAAALSFPAQMVSTWATHDGAAFGELFVDDGVLILPGTACFSRDEIAQFMTDAFAGPYEGSRVVGEPRGMRILAPNVIVIFTEGGVLAAGEDELPEASRIRATWLLVKRDEHWRLQSYQNGPLAR